MNSVSDYNTKDFMHANSLLPCESMLASKLVLKKETLCEFLKAMEDAEYDKLVREDKKIIKVTNVGKSKGGVIFSSTMGVFGGLLGGVAGGMFGLILGPAGSVTGIAIGASIGTGAVGTGMGFAGAGLMKLELRAKAFEKYSGKRKLRLMDKIARINFRISQVNQNSHEYEQLTRVKAAFETTFADWQNRIKIISPHDIGAF